EEVRKAKLEFLEEFPYEQPYSYEALAHMTDEMRQLRVRIFNLENEQKVLPYETTKGRGYMIEEKTDEGHIWITFEEKAPHLILIALSKYGFRWCHKHCAWIRSLNAQGRWAAK